MNTLDDLNAKLSEEELGQLSSLTITQVSKIILIQLSTTKGISDVFDNIEEKTINKIKNKLAKYLIKREKKVEENKQKQQENSAKAKIIANKIEKMIADEGLDISTEELLDNLGKKTSLKPKRKAKILYELKDAHGNTIKEWSGRGLQPLLIKEYIESGGNLEDLRVSI